MWKAYLKLDSWLLTKIQDIYLWVLDRTGVYVATVCFMIYAVIGTLEISDGATPWLWGLLIAFVGLSVAPKYLMQDKGENDRFNLIALLMENFRWRHMINITIGLCMVIAAISLHVLEAFADLGFVIYGYMFLIKIRDRDKKPIFEKAPEMAMEHGSN